MSLEQNTEARIVTSKRRFTNLLLIGIFVILFVNTKAIIRFGWHLWTGKQIEWNHYTIEITPDYFVFPTRDSEFLMIGMFNDSDETFPDDNYLTIQRAKVKFDLKQLPDALLKLCNKTDCKEYKEYSYTEGSVPITCVEFKGITDRFDNREFHVFCRPQGSDVLVEYHGNTEVYSRFKEQQDRALKDISHAMAWNRQR